MAKLEAKVYKVADGFGHAVRQVAIPALMLVGVLVARGRKSEKNDSNKA